MGKISSYPAMTALQGPELILGDQSGATGTTTPTAVAAYMAGLTTTPVLASYARTAAEIAAGVTPVNYAYPADPYVDPRRYGADPTGTTDSTAAVQNALNVAFQAKGILWIGNNCNFLVGGLALTITGNHTNFGIRIAGSSRGGSVLTYTGTAAGLLTISGATPTGSPQESQVVIEDVLINGPGGSNPTPNGVTFNGIAYWSLRRAYIIGFNVGLALNSSLEGTVVESGIWSCNYNLQARQDGAGALNNLVTLLNSRFCGAGIWSIDWGAGNRLKILGCDLEQNGQHTALTLSAAPAAGATSAVLAAAWTLQTAAYPVYFSDGEARMVTLTNGATTATWTTPLANAVTTAATFCTGALIVRETVCTAPGASGYATIDIDGAWFESNNGQTMAVEATANLTLAIRNSNFYTDYNGNCLFVRPIRALHISDTNAPSGSAAVWNINSSNTILKNVLVRTLIDASGSQDYSGVSVSTGVVTAPQQWAPYSFKGVTGLTVIGTAMPLQTLPSTPAATYLVSAQLAGTGDTADYASVGVVCVDNAAASIGMILTGASLSLTLSGLTVQATQTAGTSQQITYSIVQLA